MDPDADAGGLVSAAKDTLRFRVEGPWVSTSISLEDSEVGTEGDTNVGKGSGNWKKYNRSCRVPS